MKTVARRSSSVEAILAVGVMAVATALLGCESAPPTPTPTPTPPPSSGGDTFRLNLGMRSGNGMARGMNVRVMVDDVVYTRANAPYNNGNIALRNYTSDVDPDTFALDVPAGKTVTLIAVEAAGGIASAFGQPDPENSIDPFAVEFLTWEGEDTRPESGVATALMDADKDVTAVFAQMPRVLIRKLNSNNPQLIGGCYDLKIEAAERLALPGAGDISGETTGLCCCGAADSDLFSFGHVKTGTEITLNATDFNLCDAVSGVCFEEFDQWSGSAALCGSNRECMLTIGVDVDLTGTWVDRSP
jgi:hypothetical protein